MLKEKKLPTKFVISGTCDIGERPQGKPWGIISDSILHSSKGETPPQAVGEFSRIKVGPRWMQVFDSVYNPQRRYEQLLRYLDGSSTGVLDHVRYELRKYYKEDLYTVTNLRCVKINPTELFNVYLDPSRTCILNLNSA